MGEYVVQRGDSLSRIARSHQIRYWPNLYFAPGNNEFRGLRSNPSLILPGDRLIIPSSESIRPMENHPIVLHRDVPLFTQNSDTCWRATGKMLYLRQHRAEGAEAEFNRRIGAQYIGLSRGLRSAEWHDFYHTRLAMQETQITSPNELHFLIATRGPVIVAVGDGSSSHSMIMAGYNIIRGEWFVLDPAAGETLTFPDDEVVVGDSSADESSSAPTTLTQYQTGPATWRNMGRWIGVFGYTVNHRIFHY